ncbi:hypothetical protein B7R78_0005740 [Ralstonia solanacearum]|uniref:Uncharacterized protein n=1 Tax=Ralstonia solanacearum K60 TaxID=1091042 RepID=A0AAP7ZNK3_RALSL|nr:hypothetical protein [Ralstonia solanacearum]OYQ13634.1 hypothetical protein B7R77_10480 [Ralstonia solanacearum K60]QOK83682.1 hypothetical protein HF906_01695 [Ralstonia solanacearum]RIJ86693.1 hypothetical protein RSP822_09460 [Ralstonia solanacearum]
MDGWAVTDIADPFARSMRTVGSQMRSAFHKRDIRSASATGPCRIRSAPQ